MSTKVNLSENSLFPDGTPPHPGSARPTQNAISCAAPIKPNKPTAQKKALDTSSAGRVDTSGNAGALERFFTDVQVAKRYGVARATVWRWCNGNPDFPKPKQMSPGTSRWALSELLVFEDRLTSGLDPDPVVPNSKVKPRGNQ